MVSRTIPRRSEPRSPAFDKDAYHRFKLPMRYGEAISGWDDPGMVEGTRATHMREDDYVVGIVFRERARAYPLWVVDNYHVVNDRLGGERFVVVSCERCQSGAAFEAEVEGSPERAPIFRSVGFQNATLLLKDLRSGSHWVHYEGRGLDRKAAGAWLPWIPAYHMEWRDWLAQHPDTEVMVPPDDPRHPDARHGHGREEIFSRPGMDAAFIPTILGELDETYPENEMVLGIEGWDEGDPWLAYPLREVQREGGVVHAVVGEQPIVVFAGPRPDGFTMSAFTSAIDGRPLTFVRDAEMFRDLETGSSWTIEGAAVDGPLAVSALEPRRWSYVRWHAWTYFHPGTRLFRSEVRPRPFPAVAPSTRIDPFDTILSRLSSAGHDVRIGEPLVSQRRPREARHSLTVYVDDDRLVLHGFDSETAARDFHAFEASWSGFPIRPRSHEAVTRRLGTVVIESDPEERYVDPTNIVPRPYRSIRWATVLDSPHLDDLRTGDERGPAAPTPGFATIVRALRMAGHEVIDVAFLPPGQLRVGAANGVALTIDAERFLLYRFATPDGATAYAAEEPHSFAEDRFVVRSTPDTMYEHQAAEILFVGDGSIRWSPLLDDPAFRRVFREVVGDADG